MRGTAQGGQTFLRVRLPTKIISYFCLFSGTSSEDIGFSWIESVEASLEQEGSPVVQDELNRMLEHFQIVAGNFDSSLQESLHTRCFVDSSDSRSQETSSRGQGSQYEMQLDNENKWASEVMDLKNTNKNTFDRNVLGSIRRYIKKSFRSSFLMIKSRNSIDRRFTITNDNTDSDAVSDSHHDDEPSDDSDETIEHDGEITLYAERDESCCYVQVDGKEPAIQLPPTVSASSSISGSGNSSAGSIKTPLDPQNFNNLESFFAFGSENV